MHACLLPDMLRRGEAARIQIKENEMILPASRDESKPEAGPNLAHGSNRAGWRRPRRVAAALFGLAGVGALAGGLSTFDLVRTSDDLSATMVAGVWHRAVDHAKARDPGFALTFGPLGADVPRLLPARAGASDDIAKHVSAGDRVTLIAADGSVHVIKLCRDVPAEAAVQAPNGVADCIDVRSLLRPSEHSKLHSL